MPEVAPVMSTTLPSNLRRGVGDVLELFGAAAQATSDPANPAAVLPSSNRRHILPSFLSGEDIVGFRLIITPHIHMSACSAFELMLVIGAQGARIDFISR